MSESVGQALNYSQSDLFGQSLFDILHPKDVTKVKEQISSADLTPRDRFIDCKTMLPVRDGDGAAGAAALRAQATQQGRLSPGGRRSFFCRMKAKAAPAPPPTVKEEEPSSSSGQSSPAAASSNLTLNFSRKGRKCPAGHKRYVVVQCTGYLKSWAPTKLGMSSGQESETEGGQAATAATTAAVGGGSEPKGNSMGRGGGGTDPLSCMSCLVAVGRILPPSAPASSGWQQQQQQERLQEQQHHHHHHNRGDCDFSARLTTDGTFAYVDQRVTSALGFLPQELVGTSVYELLPSGDGGGGGGDGDDVGRVSEWHRAALRSQDPVRMRRLRLRAKDGRFMTLRATWRSFRNPWTKEIEYIVSRYRLCGSSSAVAEDTKIGIASVASSSGEDTQDFPSSSGHFQQQQQRHRQFFSSRFVPNGLPRELQRAMTGHHAEAANIGRQIAEEEQQTRNSAGNSPDVVARNKTADGGFNTLVGKALVGNNASVVANFCRRPSTCSGGGGGGGRDEASGSVVKPGGPTSDPGGSQSSGTGGGGSTDETNMAIMMSLLEADAGLGGTPDLNGLPWPIP